MSQCFRPVREIWNVQSVKAISDSSRNPGPSMNNWVGRLAIEPLKAHGLIARLARLRHNHWSGQ
jgi:hypothetical protein